MEGLGAMERRKAVLLEDRTRPRTRKVFDAEVLEDFRRRVDLLPEPATREDLADDPERFRDVSFVLSTWGMPDLSEAEIARSLPGLEAVFYAAGSVQAFARPFLARGVRVFSAWAANAVPVAECAAAQVVLANKGFFQTLARAKADYSGAGEFCSAFPGNYRTRVGLLGAGMVGTRTIGILRTMDLELLVYDPFLSDARAAELGVRKATLEEVFSTCQTISNHLADKPEIRGLLDYGLFSRMRPNATFLNTGRGAQVVEADLFRALEEQPDRTAVLDVTFPEPPEDMDRFRALPNLFLSPHIAGSTGNECFRQARYMLEELERLLEGRPVRYEVTLPMLETMA